MQVPDWSDYQAFLAIARAGQLARAASSMRLDATTMGRRLRRLEARLGATLFEQTREGQVLTEAGEALLASVEGMAAAQASIADQSAAAGHPGGVVRISLPEGFGGWVMPRDIASFAAAHPRLTIDLVANSGLLSLSKREADLAVTLSRPKAGPVIARRLTDYSLRLYASAQYLSNAGTPRQAGELTTGHRLIGYIPDLLFDPALNYFDELHPGLAATLRSSSINAQHHLIAAHAGIGILPCFIGDADDRIVPVLPERRIVRTFWLVMHKDTHQLARIKAAKDWILATVHKHRSALMPTI
jgi:DNA-binding transcriptional LysR family regulator